MIYIDPNPPSPIPPVSLCYPPNQRWPHKLVLLDLQKGYEGICFSLRQTLITEIIGPGFSRPLLVAGEILHGLLPQMCQYLVELNDIFFCKKQDIVQTIFTNHKWLTGV